MDVELNYVASGLVVYQHCVNQISIHSGEVAIFWRALPHHIITISPDVRLHALVIPFATFLIWPLPNELLSIITHGQLLKFNHVSLSKRCDILFDSWQNEIDMSGTTKQKVAIREVEAFLNRLSLHTPVSMELPVQTDSSRSRVSIAKVQKIAHYIALHYTELITIEQIAQAVSLNPNYAMTLFRQHFNQSIMDYLTKFRVAHAQRLLLSSNTSIHNIAQQSGFGSISQFYTTFKRAIGTTPNQYRHLR